MDLLSHLFCCQVRFCDHRADTLLYSGFSRNHGLNLREILTISDLKKLIKQNTGRYWALQRFLYFDQIAPVF
jgi:hypothetical protein